jgi:hypothetical protein
MCLVVKYVPGEAYKLFYQRRVGNKIILSSPLQGGPDYQLNKWIRDTVSPTRELPYASATTRLPGIGRINNPEHENDNFLYYNCGFHGWPSLEDAQIAIHAAQYLPVGETCKVYKVLYKKLLAQGIDESGRPTLVFRYMKIVGEPLWTATR